MEVSLVVRIEIAFSCNIDQDTDLFQVSKTTCKFTRLKRQDEISKTITLSEDEGERTNTMHKIVAYIVTVAGFGGFTNGPW